MLLNSISRKVLVGYGAIVVIVVLVSSVLFTGLSGINRVTDEFVESSLPALENVNEVNLSLNRLLVAAYGLYGYTIEKGEFESTLANEMSSLASNTQRLRSHILSSEKIAFDQLEADLVKFESIMTSGEVDWDQARTFLTKIQDEVSRIEAIISQSAALISGQANTKTETINQDVSRMILWLSLSVLSIVLITIIAYAFAKKQVASPIKSLAVQLDQVVENNDLRRTVTIQSNDEVALTAKSINQLLAAFRQVNQDIGASATVVKEAIDLLGHSATLSDEEVEKLSSVVETMLGSSEQLAHSIADAASRSKVASEIAQTGADQVATGTNNISQTADIIAELSRDIDTSSEMLLSLKIAGDKVSDVVKTIADIADQTNLLALNAAIEAARAGETGRGFAVVAGEVRTLASRTHDSTFEINAILEQIVTSISATVDSMEVNKSKANEAVTAAETTVGSLQEIQTTVQSLSAENLTLANAAQSSQQDISRMKLDIDNINSGMLVVADSSAETKSAAATLAKLALDLEGVSQQFKT